MVCELHAMDTNKHVLLNSWPTTYEVASALFCSVLFLLSLAFLLIFFLFPFLPLYRSFLLCSTVYPCRAPAPASLCTPCLSMHNAPRVWVQLSGDWHNAATPDLTYVLPANAGAALQRNRSVTVSGAPAAVHCGAGCSFSAFCSGRPGRGRNVLHHCGPAGRHARQDEGAQAGAPLDWIACTWVLMRKRHSGSAWPAGRHARPDKERM